MQDPFAVLGIARDASLDEAKAAYRRLAMLFHPDRLQALRPAVREEGERRLREATQALREVQARFGRPLRAAGHGPPKRAGTRETRREARAEVDVFVPMDARMYAAELSSIDEPRLMVRWGGRHAAAVLNVLKREHRIGDGPIHQIEWGAYAVRMPGADITRLLEWVLPEGCRDTSAVVVAAEGALRDRLAGTTAVPEPEVPLRRVLSALDDDAEYSLVTDLY